MILSKQQVLRVASRRYSTLPRAKKLPLVDTLRPIFIPKTALKLHEHVDSLHKKLGPIFVESVGPIECVFISNPLAMRKVFANEGKHPKHVLPDAWTTYNQKHGNSRGLFFMDDAEWLKYRKIMNKVILKPDQTLIEDACKPIAKSLHQELSKKCQKHGYAANLESALFTWSLASLLSILIGPNTTKNWLDILHNDVKTLGEANKNVFVTTSQLSLISSKTACKYNIPSWRRFETAVSSSLSGSKMLVEKLLKDYVHPSGLLYQMRENNMSDLDIIRIITDLVLAAGDTTSYSMQWLLYCLAKHQNSQSELRNGFCESSFKNVLRETLRLYPIAPFLTRIMPEQIEILGYTIPANSLIVMSIYTSGRNQENFENPLEFRPERWSRSNSENDKLKYMQMASLPFAMGARSCIGRKIAEAQMKTTLEEILSRHKIVLENEREVDFILKMVGVPSEPIKLNLVPL